MRKQVSETIWLGVLLAFSGGLMDAYSYLFRGKVFANAQTGNILLLSVSLSKGEWETALHYACPVLAFSCGIALAALIRRICWSDAVLHWRQLCVLLEAVTLFAVAWFPQSVNLAANSLISLACGIQVETFRKIEGNSIATTMCIGDLRLAVHSLVEQHGSGENNKERKTAAVSLTIILAFAVGAVMGSGLIRCFGTYAVWASTALLLVCFAGMFARTGSGEGVRAH